MKILIACVVSTMLLIGNAQGLTFEGSGVTYETLETENFIVRYEPGDKQAAKDVAEALENSHEKITQDLGVKPKGKTIIELYTTPGLYNQYRKPASWAIGGKIYPEKNMMLLPSPSTWGKRDIHRYEDLWHVLPHEYAHVILRRYEIPMWLDEGIAVYESGQWNTGYQRLLQEAHENNDLLLLQELEDFNTFIVHGPLSYAESRGIRHIPSRRNNPQTNGKFERWIQEYKKHRHRFDSAKEFMTWYNNRIHGALDLEIGETPNEAFVRRLRPEALLGLFFRNFER